MGWAKAPQQRDQLVLFPTRLDDAVGPDHLVRLLDDILSRLDWTRWESAYDLRRGQPPIHPRILASVILYGLLNRIRSSRCLEEALQVRLDFRWLVEGRSLEHTTLSEFRRKNAAALKDTFVQIGMVAREMGCLPLAYRPLRLGIPRRLVITSLIFAAAGWTDTFGKATALMVGTAVCIAASLRTPQLPYCGITTRTSTPRSARP